MGWAASVGWVHGVSFDGNELVRGADVVAGKSAEHPCLMPVAGTSFVEMRGQRLRAGCRHAERNHDHVHGRRPNWARSWGSGNNPDEHEAYLSGGLMAMARDNGRAGRLRDGDPR